MACRITLRSGESSWSKCKFCQPISRPTRRTRPCEVPWLYSSPSNLTTVRFLRRQLVRSRFRSASPSFVNECCGTLGWLGTPRRTSEALDRGKTLSEGLEDWWSAILVEIKIEHFVLPPLKPFHADSTVERTERLIFKHHEHAFAEVNSFRSCRLPSPKELMGARGDDDSMKFARPGRQL